MVTDDILGVTPMDEFDNDDTRKKKLEESRRNALYYGWEYFKYHAQQRQAVFRFYLVLVGVALAGLISSYSNQYAELATDRWVVGISLIVLSLLFWRLDVRSYQLVKVAESFLFDEEQRLAAELSTQTIRLTANADQKRNAHWGRIRLATFRQIYGWMFFIVGLGGFAIIADSLKLLKKFFH